MAGGVQATVRGGGVKSLQTEWGLHLLIEWAFV